MEKTIYKQISEKIEHIFGGEKLNNKIIIYPCGDVGFQTLSIMEKIYNLSPAFIIDNYKSKYSDNIYDKSLLEKIDCNKYFIFITTVDAVLSRNIKKEVKQYFAEDRIIELDNPHDVVKKGDYRLTTKIGKYSYGPICTNHEMIKSIGAFCSFAQGVDYVTNHESRYISIHLFIYGGKNFEGVEAPYSEHFVYLEGIEPPTDKIYKQKRAVIGNDVWLGRNVIVTNSANIGNGVIAAAGAVITKDVPDYAVVAGVPARIIRYRYNKEQIDALNRIAWWDWDDDLIRERHADFYIPVDEFISKYLSE